MSIFLDLGPRTKIKVYPLAVFGPGVRAARIDAIDDDAPLSEYPRKILSVLVLPALRI